MLNAGFSVKKCSSANGRVDDLNKRFCFMVNDTCTSVLNFKVVLGDDQHCQDQ